MAGPKPQSLGSAFKIDNLLKETKPPASSTFQPATSSQLMSAELPALFAAAGLPHPPPPPPQLGHQRGPFDFGAGFPYPPILPPLSAAYKCDSAAFFLPGGVYPSISLYGGDQSGKACRRRKARTVFSDAQLSGLEQRFETQRYLSTPERIELANQLSLTEVQVKTWFQNRRMKHKKLVRKQTGQQGAGGVLGGGVGDIRDHCSGADDGRASLSSFVDDDEVGDADRDDDLSPASIEEP